MWPVIASAQEQILALQKALAERDEALRLEREQREALSKQHDDLVGELRVTRTERDLLKERLNKFLRKLFDARSEALVNQKELFFNEAEADGAHAQPVEEEPVDEDTVDIPAHKRIDYVQPGVGHYGVFNGSRWRAEIAPRIRDFIRSNRTLGSD